jgi:hypothetical protein
MLITFSTKHYADIIMFGDVGLSMLKMMGQSGTVPSAIKAEDVPTALANLQTSLKNQTEPEPKPEDIKNDDEAPVISINQRALPLIELLTIAAKENSDVMWK